MLIFASDLHLADHGQPPFSFRQFLDELESLVMQARRSGAEKIKLILLGDIFEILKSDVWIEEKVRPWEEPTPSHERAVELIVRSIYERNRELFDGLNSLQAGELELRLQYVPGNHDRPLGEEMGASARVWLKDRIDLGARGANFSETLSDLHHQTVAFHGHHLDPWNRYNRDGRCAAGDAIVVEFLVGLRVELRNRLGLSDSALAFIGDIGHIESAEPGIAGEWLVSGLERLKIDRSAAEEHLKAAAVAITRSFRRQVRKVDFEPLEVLKWWERFLGSGAIWLLGQVPSSDLPGFVPRERPAQREYIALMARELARRNRGKRRYRFVVCGHTHIADEVKMPNTNDPDDVYLNSGTWCRLYKRSGAKFTSSQKGTFVVIRTEKEQEGGLPAYESRRITAE